DAATAISPDGQMLFVYRSSEKDGGDIYVARKAGNDWTTPMKLPGDINKPGSWEGSVTMAADGNTIYFASDRAGGLGGKDIYRATLAGDSAWGNVTNLGATINSVLDDDAPCLSVDGSTLYFSSRGFNSMGGYDIFFSRLAADMISWDAAQNMGVPVNSTADDIYFQPTSKRNHAVFSSNRKGGNGMMDIYFSSPSASEQVTIYGLITLDGKPVSAIVALNYKNQSGGNRDNKMTAENGMYSVSVRNSEDYNLKFTVKGKEALARTFTSGDIKSYPTKEINVEFVSMRTDTSTNFQNEPDETAVDPGFYVVIGSFMNVENAIRLEESERARGVYPKVQRVFNKNNGYMYVTVAHPDSHESSTKVVQEARKMYPDAWIQFLK
ncbi:MAG TPA: hypothetical protein VI731_08980, partial [Bacteroidia bacterium]|nr:hypothetical protein [Bacteroidia bacterium]